MNFALNFFSQKNFSGGAFALPVPMLATAMQSEQRFEEEEHVEPILQKINRLYETTYRQIPFLYWFFLQ